MRNIRRVKDGRKHEEATAVTAAAARDLFGDLIARARLMGERTVITRNGKRVAAIVPIADYEKLTAA